MAKQQLQVRKMGKGTVTLFIIVGMMAIVFIKSSFLFLLIAVIPSFAAYYGDLSEHRKYYQSVIACNIAGLSSYLAQLIASGNTWNAFENMATDMKTWLVIYSFAGLGYLLVWLCPQIAELIIELSQRSKIMRLEAMHKRLVYEWGPEIETHNDGLTTNKPAATGMAALTHQPDA